jgi:aryl-alcohol dehydrogenase-like predicted oxidoreductase
VPIPGTKRVRYLEENAAAVALRLTPGELAAIDAASPGMWRRGAGIASQESRASTLDRT